MGFTPGNYTMQQVAEILARFLGDECNKLDQSAKLTTNMGFLLGGYSKPGDFGESWSVEIKNGVPQPPKKLRQDEEVGLSWGGMTEVIQRIILGFSPGLFQTLAEVTNPPQDPVVLASQLGPVLTARLQAPLVFAPMPIQDVIDLARFLVHSAIMFSRFLIRSGSTLRATMFGLNYCPRQSSTRIRLKLTFTMHSLPLQRGQYQQAKR